MEDANGDLLMAAMVQEVEEAQEAIKAGAGECGFCTTTPATYTCLPPFTDVNHANEHGMTALHIACAGTGPKPMLDLLIQHQADVDASDKVRQQNPCQLSGPADLPPFHAPGWMDTHHVCQ